MINYLIFLDAFVYMTYVNPTELWHVKTNEIRRRGKS